MSKEWISQELHSVAESFHALAELAPTIAEIAERCAAALQAGGKVIFCGNGGSAADSQHLAAEFVGRYKLERPALNSIALTVDTSILTAVGNDYGYDEVFRRQVEGIGKAGDVLIGLSTSGNSRNVVLAFEQARSMGITTVALTGAGGGKMKEAADIALPVPAGITNHIQEMHITCGHLICELTEKMLFPTL
ncbi:MAG: D-sedoheptulose 7-phosphate isomerase [Akkermansia sp.]|nr:D-sedoheptulose 7-phosphate isomerase [Akkermansia sp.]